MYIEYPNRAKQCTRILTITIKEKIYYNACNTINVIK